MSNKKKSTISGNIESMKKTDPNTANKKGAQDLGINGTKPTASQQQGQGSWKKNDTETRDGSRDS